MEIVVGFEKLNVEEAIYANGGEAITDIVGGALGVLPDYRFGMQSVKYQVLQLRQRQVL